MEEILVNEIESFKREKRSFSIAFMDIDRLKEANDTYGHLAGDRLIKHFAMFLKSTVRSCDCAIRFGGDEFICVMPDTHRSEAVDICTRLQERCRQTEIGDMPLTISIGISSHPEDGDDLEALLHIADEALYDAKRSGRDRIGSRGRRSLEIPLKAFVNRLPEKEEVRRLIPETATEERVCVVRGNVGIGKTRLVREVLNSIAGREILWADCIPFTDSISYYPIRELLKYKIRRHAEEIMEGIPFVYKIEISKLIPEMISGNEEIEHATNIVLDRYRLYEGVRYLICAGDRQRIIILDNAQWIDRESIEVLKYLLRSMESMDVTFIFILREETRNQEMEDLIAYIGREIHVKEIMLRPFGESDMRRLIALILGQEPEEKLVTFLAQESGGNPYYIEEITRELFGGGQLCLEDGHWDFKKPMKPVIPKRLEDISQWKYQSLGQEARRVLEVASVVGRFDLSILQEFTGYNEGHVIGLVDDIHRMGFIKEIEHSFVFNDEVTRKAIYKKNVEGFKGRELHEKMGCLLEERYRGREASIIEELALHFYRARDREKAANYCIIAGEKAMERFAGLDARRYYTWAVEMMKTGDEDEDSRRINACVLNLGDIHELFGEHEDAIACYERFFRHAKDKAPKARAKNRIAKTYQILGRFGESLTAIDEAEDLLSGDSDSEMIERIETLLLRSRVYQIKGDIEESTRQAKLALSMCEELDVDERSKARWEMEVHGILGRNSQNRGEYLEAEKSYRSCLEASEACGDRQGMSKAYAGLGTAYLTIGQHDEANGLFQSALRIAEEISDIKNISNVHRLLGTLNQIRGEFEAALDYYQKYHAISRKIGDTHGVAMANNQIGTIHLYRGEYDKASSFFQDYLNLSKEIDYPQGVFEATSNLGSISLKKGDFEQAIQLYERSLPIVEKIGDKRVTAIIKVNLATAYNYLGAYDKAIELNQQVLALSEAIGLRSMIGVVLCNSGAIQYDKGNLEKAIDLYERALEIAEELEDKLVCGEVFYNFGLLHFEKGEIEQADEFLGRARDVLLDVGDKEKLVDVYLLIAEARARDNADCGEVEEYLQKAWVLIEELDSKQGRAAHYFASGRIQKRRGDFAEARAHLDKALECFKELKWRKMVGRACAEYAGVLSISGKMGDAISYFEKARSIFQDLALDNLVKEVDEEIAEIRSPF